MVSNKLLGRLNQINMRKTLVPDPFVIHRHRDYSKTTRRIYKTSLFSIFYISSIIKNNRLKNKAGSLTDDNARTINQTKCTALKRLEINHLCVWEAGVAGAKIEFTCTQILVLDSAVIHADNSFRVKHFLLTPCIKTATMSLKI